MNKQLMYYFQGDNTQGTTRNRYAENSESGNNNDSSNNNNNERGKVTVCNCNRSPETIMCKVCGRSFVGRKRMSCERHKNTIHLMDCAYCVFCKRQL